MIDAEVKENNFLNVKIIGKVMFFIITILMIIFIIWGIKLGVFRDRNLLILYIKEFGLLAPICFVLLQIVQVILPVVPGGVSCIVGVMAFGPVMGFIYNYIGLVIGSCIAYFLANKYGLKLVEKLFKRETIDKYLKYIQRNYFSKIFWIGIFLPGLPDDLLCYIAGISKMTFRKFLIILLVGKPLSLLTYSLFMRFF